MREGEGLSPLLFRVVCLGFSAALLVLALFGQIRLLRVRAEIEGLRTALAEAENNGRLAAARLESALPLDELESYALFRRGMQHPAPGQIIMIEYAG